MQAGKIMLEIESCMLNKPKYSSVGFLAYNKKIAVK